MGPASADTSSGSSAMPQIGHAPGPGLPDLGMHRAGVDRACRDRLGAPRLGLQILGGIGHELLPASGRAEVVRAPIVRVAMLGGVRVDCHAAHRVLDALLGMLVRIVLGMRCMGVSFVSRHDDPSLSAGTLRGYLLTSIPLQGINQV